VLNITTGDTQLFFDSTFQSNTGSSTLGCLAVSKRIKVPHLADIYTGRPTKAPEINQKIPYDPFAADVYQTGAMLLSLCWVCFFWQAILHHLIPNALLALDIVDLRFCSHHQQYDARR